MNNSESGRDVTNTKNYLIPFTFTIYNNLQLCVHYLFINKSKVADFLYK